jgi:ABC-type multidrug transport system fused ATPase/permease subunit
VWARSIALVRPLQRDYQKYLAGIVVRQILLVLGGFSLVWLLRIIQPGSAPPLGTLIGALLLFDLGLAALDRLLGMFFASRISLPLFRNLRVATLEKVLAMPMEWHHAQNPVELVSKLNNGAGKVVQTAETMGRELLPALIRTGLSLIPLLWFSALTTPFVILGLIAFLYQTARENRKRQAHRVTRHEQYAQDSGLFTECAQNVQALVQFGQSDRMLGRYEDLQRAIIREAEAEIDLSQRFAVSRGFLISAIRRLSQGIWLWEFQRGRLDAAMVMYLNFLTDELIGSFGTYAGVLERLYDGFEPARAVATLLNEESQDRSCPGGALRTVPAEVRLELKNVNFSYQNGTNVLRDVSLSVEPGTVLGIVGGTGIGKTTLQHLLSRMLDAREGEVVVAGADVREWPVRQLRSLFVSVSQNGGVLFAHNTVFDTIRFGRADATAAEVKEAARWACIDTDIEGMPRGYETTIGPGGVHLSKGQQQRIGLAQALLALQNRKVLILDEFTSALDSRTEQQIIDNLKPLLRGKTVIIIAHRLATLRKLADRIVVLERGRIVEDGSHMELVSQGSRYAELVRLQNIA